MSVAAPPRPPRPEVGPEPEALIEEARRRARRRRLVVAAVVVVLVGAGLAIALAREGGIPWATGSSGAGGAPGRGVDLEITVYEGAPSKETRHFTLRCRPPSGTLPFAARVCADIAHHPQAMLRPAKSRSTCTGFLDGPTVEVRGSAGGAPVGFGGLPGCEWPVGVPLIVYWAASHEDANGLRYAEARIRCADDPAVVGANSGTSRLACLQGLWTPRVARMIRVAKRVPALAGLPGGLFPENIGVQPCRIPVGNGARRIGGLCGVSLERTQSGPVLTFVEAWSGIRRGHTWRVLVRGGHADLTLESGPAPPQTWT